jgi:hypothetical protein
VWAVPKSCLEILLFVLLVRVLFLFLPSPVSVRTLGILSLI